MGRAGAKGGRRAVGVKGWGRRGAKGWGRRGAKSWGRVGRLECDGVRHLSRAVDQQFVAPAAVDQPAASQLAEDVSGVPLVARHRRHGRATARGRTVAASRLARLRRLRRLRHLRRLRRRRLRRLRRCRRRSEVPVAWRVARRIHKHELALEIEIEITRITLGLGLQFVLQLALGTATATLRTAAAAAAAAAAAGPSQNPTRRALSSPQPPRHPRHWPHGAGWCLRAAQQHHTG